MTAEQLRKVSGGVVGHLTPKECVIDLAAAPFNAATGSSLIGLKVPAHKFVYGAYIKNDADDLASAGAATIKVTVGSTDVISAQGISDLKGKGVAALDATPDYAAAEREVKVTIGTAVYTAGKVTIGVIYG